MRRAAMATFISGAVGISTLSVKTASAGLVGAWDFSQTSGQTVTDSSGNGFIATLGSGSQAPTLLSGSAAGLPVAGGVAAFDGQQNQFVAVNGGGGLNALSTGTIGMWVNWTSSNQMAGYSNLLYGGVMSRQSDSQFTNDLIGLSGADPNSAHIVFWGATADGTQLVSNATPGVNQWHYLAIVFTPTSQQMYIDGTLDASISAGAGTAGDNALTPLTLGAWSGDGSSYSTAELANVSVWDNAMTADQVQALSSMSLDGQNGNAPEPAGLAMVGVAVMGMLARRRSRGGGK